MKKVTEFSTVQKPPMRDMILEKFMVSILRRLMGTELKSHAA